METRPTDTIDIPVQGASAGIINISIVDGRSSSKKKAIITYTPDPSIKPPPTAMSFSYRDSAGQPHFSWMIQQNDQWVSERELELNESTDFGLHPNGRPKGGPPNIINKISLMNGKLIKEAYANPNLQPEEKGHLEKRVMSRDGKLSDPLNNDYKLGEGERLVDVYLPAGYNPSSSHSYGLQVFLDGDMHVGTDSFGNRVGTKDILDNLIASGKMEPTIAVFSAPTKPTWEKNENDWGAIPRLREYACNSDTDHFLASIPSAMRNAGLNITKDPDKTSICGQSLGGLQALYTAKKHPDIFGKVIAQSPSVWWGPSPERLAGNEPAREVRYKDDATWRAELKNVDQQRYLSKMIRTGMDDLTGDILPTGTVKVYIQAGTAETGNLKLGNEPLTQAAVSLANELKVNCMLHDGGHAAEAWAAGLALFLPQAHPKLEHKLENRTSSPFLISKRLSDVLTAEPTNSEEVNRDRKLEQADFTSLTFEEFDQLPNSYCRKLTAAGKFDEAIEAGIIYLKKNEEKLTSYQKCVLRWHIGQGFATCGNNERAIEYFRLAAEDNDNMTKLFGPAAQAYFNATVAFLNHNSELVKQQLQDVLKISIKDYPPSNVVLIPGLIHNMVENPDKSYKEVFGMKPSLPPFPGKSDWHIIDVEKSKQNEGDLVLDYRVQLEIENMLISTSKKFGNKFEQFCSAVGEAQLDYFKKERPLKHEMMFIQDNKHIDLPSAVAIKRRQTLTAVLSSDKGIDAFEQKLISLKDVMAQPHPHHLRALFSEHGFTALKEGLITPKDALRFGENSSQYLEELCTENGLTALRTAKSQGNIDGFISGIIQHANKYNNAGALEHSLKTGISLDKVQSDIENAVQPPRFG